MTKEELLMLVKAGYTKEEIKALTEEPAEPQKEPAEEPAEEPQKEPAEEPKPTEPQTELAELKKQFADMSAELGNIVKGLQKANIANARQNEPSTTTVDDILKEMLNPSIGGK